MQKLMMLVDELIQKWFLKSIRNECRMSSWKILVLCWMIKNKERKVSLHLRRFLSLIRGDLEKILNPRQLAVSEQWREWRLDLRFEELIRRELPTEEFFWKVLVEANTGVSYRKVWYGIWIKRQHPELDWSYELKNKWRSPVIEI